MMEVLISLFIMAIVFLSLLAYQIALLKKSESLNFETIATQQILNFSEILLASTIDSSQKTFFSEWNRNNAVWLPQGVGEYSADAHHCVVQLHWFFEKGEFKSLDVYC